MSCLRLGRELVLVPRRVAAAGRTLRRPTGTCGQVRLLGSGSENEEGTYWRYEMAVRELESELAG